MLALWPSRLEIAEKSGKGANLLRNFISFYYQAYRAAVWGSRHNFLSASGE
jgi:hypothetical protein